MGITTAIVPYDQRFGTLAPGDVKAQVQLIQQVMSEVMQEDVHYGKIPGTGNRPSLLQPGAQKLCLTFRLDPQFETTEAREGAHLSVHSKCTLYHIPTGQRFGSGMGSCSTKEARYAYRKAGRHCPACSAEAIVKGKDFQGDGKPTGWVCLAKRDGCGAKYQDGDPAIEAQEPGRVPNEDLADQYNTVLKMANKRALVAATLNTLAASDIFSQDLEDTPPPMTAEPSPPERARRRAPPPGADPPGRKTCYIVTGAIQTVTAYEGKNKEGKPYVRYVIVLRGEGPPLQTFDRKIAEEAKRSQEAGARVRIEAEQRKVGRGTVEHILALTWEPDTLTPEEALGEQPEDLEEGAP